MKPIPILLAALVGLLGRPGLGAEPPPKPDILLIMPDQMRGDCLSLLGHPSLHTPHLDRLAEQGALFRRAYSTVPSCIPARHALLTGLFPQTSGVVGFRARRIACPTLPQSLSDLGYATVLVGRNMHQIPPEDGYGYQKRVLGSTYVANDDYDTFFRKGAPDSGGIRELVLGHGLTFNGWQAKPWPLADALHPSAWIVDQARQVVKETPADQPLFLTASFYAPHPPLFPPKKHFEACLKRELPQPAHGDWVEWPTLSPKGDQAGHRVLLAGETLRAAQAGYFGLIEHLDDQISPLIEAFKNRSVQAGRPWLIAVTSDHGEMLGDHGYFRKCEPYEGSANIPFVLAGSCDLNFQAGLRSTEPVCLEDLMPTFLELAGASPPEPMDGISLVPYLRGKRGVIREWLHLEHAPCYSKAQAFHALVNRRYKYVWRPLDGTEQLFDLKNDPTEQHDLSPDPSHRAALEGWRQRLAQRLVHRPEGFSDGHRLIPGRPYPPLQTQRPQDTGL